MCELGTQPAIAELARLAQTSLPVRVEALRSLARCAPDHPVLLPQLERDLRSYNTSRRIDAMQTLNFAGAHAHPLINRICIEALVDPSPAGLRRLDWLLGYTSVHTPFTFIVQWANSQR
jgi:hypothetical protein